MRSIIWITLTSIAMAAFCGCGRTLLDEDLDATVTITFDAAQLTDDRFGEDAETSFDGQTFDGEPGDSGSGDAELFESGVFDAGGSDDGGSDSGSFDGESSDAAALDGAEPDAGPAWGGGAPGIMASAEQPPIGLAVDDTRVYWLSPNTDVLECPVAGCPGNMPTLLASGVGDGYAYAIAAGASNV